MNDKKTNESIVLHLIVVGFHHKKGCLVEYCYPTIDTKDSNSDCRKSDDKSAIDSEELRQKSDSNDRIVFPEIWRTLPSLALPDGSHNHERDAIYFHLPDIADQSRTIFGISCYRQINANKLIARTTDITRGTVQKSVVVLSRLPLYGLIEAKLEMITHAYFRELDFSKVALLEETYHNLNAQLSPTLLKSSELYVGLTPRQLVHTFHHKILQLFKLLLLERKVLFYKSPVKELCVSILSLCSLMPGLIEKGLKHCSVSVHPKNVRQLSSDVELCTESEEFLVLTAEPIGTKRPEMSVDLNIADISSDNNCSEVDKSCDYIETNNSGTNGDSDDDLLKEIDEVLSEKSSNSSVKSTPTKERRQVTTQSIFYDSNAEPKPERVDKIEDSTAGQERTETPPILKLSDDDCGLPLQLFTCGAYLQPYLSLTYLDVLTDVRVRSCLVGATNFLFKQKKDIFDVIIELDGGKVDVLDVELRKQLTLTTEDLRFADFLCKNVLTDSDSNGENGDIFVDGTGWEGSDEWIRYQFKVYLLHMLRSSEMDESSRDYLSFNSNFMSAWRSTHNYKLWSAESHPMVFEVTAGHPFGGQLSVSDMRLRLSHIFNSNHKSDPNKKLNQTVVRTSKAVGGAVTTAKSAISSAVTTFWNSWSTPTPSKTFPASDADSKPLESQTKSQKRVEAETQL